MNVYTKIAVAAAAVLIVAIVGYNLLPGRSTGVGGPAQSPSAPPAATESVETAASPAGSGAFESQHFGVPIAISAVGD